MHTSGVEGEGCYSGVGVGQGSVVSAVVVGFCGVWIGGMGSFVLGGGRRLLWMLLLTSWVVPWCFLVGVIGVIGCRGGDGLQALHCNRFS